jgi:hypothetical protein
MAVQKQCMHCGIEFSVIPTRAKSAKFCSRVCSDTHPRSKDNVNCINCGKPFHVKPNQISTNLGNACSMDCAAEHRKKFYSGDRNPNFKGKNTDHDGYAISIPEAVGVRVKLHKYNAEIAFGGKIPNGLQIHHRDCDKLNNDPSNLCLLTRSDHNWLHKQFGNATLWAFMNGKIGLEHLKEWSDDPSRAERLLILDVEMQGIIYNHVKTLGDDEYAAISRYKPMKVSLVEVEELNETKRGAKGLGSTGRK